MDVETIAVNDEIRLRIYAGDTPTIWIDARVRAQLNEQSGDWKLVGFYIYPQEIEPLREALAEANRAINEAKEKENA